MSTTPTSSTLSSPLREGFPTDTDPSSYASDQEDVGKDFSVRLPDLFSSIMSIDPHINTNYDQVKSEADSWIAEVFQLSEKQAARNRKADFAFMNAIWAPHADDVALRLMVDWHHWVFAFDDQFDEGHLNDNVMEAATEIIETLALLDDTHPHVTAEQNQIRHVFQSTWYRYRERSSPELQSKYKERVRQYCLGVLSQVGVKQDCQTITLDKYMDFRRGSIGTYPSFSLVEYAHGIRLPREVQEHPSIAICEEVASDLVILVNDLLSYRKDLEQGVDHNVITLLKGQGQTTQQAVDKVGDMLDEAYRKWYGALANLPSWGEKYDKEALKYIDGCRNVALGNLHWSFASGRYLKDEGDEVRRTRVLRLPAGA